MGCFTAASSLVISGHEEWNVPRRQSIVSIAYIECLNATGWIEMERTGPLTTPDGRYVIVRGRLWRATNPHLPSETRAAFVAQLMSARREVRTAKRAADTERLAEARSAVNAAKIALGERGPVWWTDGAKDFNRHLVQNTPYAQWYRDQLSGLQTKRSPSDLK